MGEQQPAAAIIDHTLSTMLGGALATFVETREPLGGQRMGARGCLLSTLLMLIGVFGCMGTLYVVADNSCVQAANLWLPDYPGSRLVSQEQTWLRAFGIGETTRILYTTDDAEQVRRWYYQEDITKGSAGQSRDRNIAVLRWTVSPESQTGGALIRLFSSCAPELALSGQQ